MVKELDKRDLLHFSVQRLWKDIQCQIVSAHQFLLCMLLLLVQSTQEFWSDLLFMIVISHRIICLISSTFLDSDKSLQFMQRVV